MNNLERVFDLCRHTGSNIYKKICIGSVVGMYMNQKGSYDSGISLCKTAPDDIRRTCNIEVENRRAFFN